MEKKGIISAFLEENYKHFNAAALMDASKAYIAHLNAGGKMMITLGGAMSTAELGKTLAEMIRQDNPAFDYRDSFYYCDGAEEKIAYFEPGKQGYAATLSEEFYADAQSYAREYLEELYNNKYCNINAEYADVLLYQIASDERESNKGESAE